MRKTICLLVLTISLLFSLQFTVMAQDNKTHILVLIHSDHGGTYQLAKEVAQGIEHNSDAVATIKLVQASNLSELKDIPVAQVGELSSYDGIAFGSPVYFGNISTAMSAFLAQTVDLWSTHALEGMPAMVFMSAGSGAGNDLALQSFWNSLAVHGMILMSNGIRGTEQLDRSVAQGSSVLGATSLNAWKSVSRPSESERKVAFLQGEKFAQVSQALKGTFAKNQSITIPPKEDIHSILKEKHIVLPQAPAPVGNYTAFSRTGNLVFINQVALLDGHILYPGKITVDLTEEQAKEASRQTMLNVIAVLKNAVGGDLNKVKKCVQLTGIFNTPEHYSNHAVLMNPASDLSVDIFGERGKHARGTLGASSLPVNSAVEIQAIFEVE